MAMLLVSTLTIMILGEDHCTNYVLKCHVTKYDCAKLGDCSVKCNSSWGKKLSNFFDMTVTM